MAGQRAAGRERAPARTVLRLPVVHGLGRATSDDAGEARGGRHADRHKDAHGRAISSLRQDFRSSSFRPTSTRSHKRDQMEAVYFRMNIHLSHTTTSIVLRVSLCLPCLISSFRGVVSIAVRLYKRRAIGLVRTGHLIQLHTFINKTKM